VKGYTKLHAKIVVSSIWEEPMHVRIVWITMLAMADQDGIVEGAVNGLARLARVTSEQCEEALTVLKGPDPYSSDGTTGERIEDVPGGWLVLNHANYRDKQTREQALTAERVRRYRERKKKDITLPSVTPVTANVGNAPKRASASASASASDDAFDSWYQQYPIKKGKKAAQRAWGKLKASERKAALDDIPKRLAFWKANNPKYEYIQHPATFLNNGGWEDEMVDRRKASDVLREQQAETKRQLQDPSKVDYTPDNEDGTSNWDV